MFLVSSRREDNYARTRAIELDFEIQELQEKCSELENSADPDWDKINKLYNKIFKLQRMQFAIDPYCSFMTYKYTPPEPGKISKFFAKFFAKVDQILNYICTGIILLVLFVIAGVVVIGIIQGVFKLLLG